MILVSKEAKPFTYTAKGTPRRKAVITDYETEIEELYGTVEDTAINGFTSPETWSLEASRAYARTVVLGVMMTTLGDDDDLFAHGCDRFGHYASSALLLTLTQIYTNAVFGQPGLGRSLSTVSALAPGSTLGVSRMCSYTKILPSTRSESSLPTWYHRKRWLKPSVRRWNECSLWLRSMVPISQNTPRRLF